MASFTFVRPGNCGVLKPGEVLMPHGSWAVERSVVGIDENGQVMR